MTAGGPPHRPLYILPIIVFAQFAGTSVWFATNAVAGDLEVRLGVTDLTVWLTGAVQLGFIVGSLGVAVTRLADRVPGRTLFLTATVLAALANAAVLAAGSAWLVLVARVVCGLALAGVYPVGMKIVAGWYRRGLGGALGWLVGALVLGTAFPHLLRASSTAAPLTGVVLGTSALAVVGGLAVFLLVPGGPHETPASSPRASDLARLWRHREYRCATLGYVGHMWELYTLWAVLPAFFTAFVFRDPGVVAGLSFLAVAGGSATCVLGGLLSRWLGSVRVASGALLGSVLCCAIAPFVFQAGSSVRTAVLLIVWGGLAVADSPQLSTLTAQGAPPVLRGTGLALATGLGFGITVVSLSLAAFVPLVWIPWMLLPGPALGLVALNRRGG